MTLRRFTRWALFSAIAIVALMALAACGGDDSTASGPGGVSSGTGSDKQYVADICKAGKTFADDLSSITKDPSKLDTTDLGKIFAEPFDKFAKAVAKAKPPSDLKDYHSQIVKTLTDTAAQMKTSKDLSALSALGDSKIPDPPQAAKDRLSKEAAANPDCKDSGFDFAN